MSACICVFSLDHIFACSHSSAFTVAGETHKSSRSNFGIVEPDKDNFLFSFAAIGEEWAYSKCQGDIAS